MSWISVKKKLPSEKNHMVLCINMNDKHTPMFLGKFLGDFWWIESQIEDIKEMVPTHWMELPNPPEGS